MRPHMDQLAVPRSRQARLSWALLVLFFATNIRLASSQEGACSASGTNPCGSGVCIEGPGGTFTCQCSSADGQILARMEDGTPTCGDFYGECHSPLLCGDGFCTLFSADNPEDGTSTTTFGCSCSSSFSSTVNLDGNVQCIPGSQDSREIGLVEGPNLAASHLNPYSRHWSLWYTGSAAAPNWTVPSSVDWRTVEGVLPPVQTMFGCGASWAFAAAAAFDSAWAITHGASQPLVSRQQFLDCTGVGSGCKSGHPGDAFEYAARLADAGKGLRDALHYQYLATQDNCTADIRVRGGNFGMSMYERIVPGNWKQLAAAVAAQPVVVSMVGSFATFVNYTGASVYSDPECYSQTGAGFPPLDHTVLVVGYSLPAEGDPFWIIQNSWGSAWGDQGYGYIAIQTEAGAPGICGMHVEPALYPVVRGPDPCAGINPCGNGTCTSDQSGGYTCTCPDLFLAVTSIDGTQTCAPASVCESLPSNPCDPGTCASDNQGSYVCECPKNYVQWRQGIDSVCRPANPRLTGYDAGGPLLPTDHLSTFSRHVSVLFSGSSTKPAWKLPRVHDWRRQRGVLPPVMDMAYCGASWAFSSAAAIESAWALTYKTTAPGVSRQELIDCARAQGGCSLGTPLDAFEYVANLTASGSGLSAASDYTYKAQEGTYCRADSASSGQPKYGISYYERMDTDSWQQLAAAVTRQPLVVALVGSYPTFVRLKGKRVYSDQRCYDQKSLDNILDHSVLLVGFSLPRRGVPFWIIQNSWGQSWGDRGYGYIKIQPGAGICGIQSTPALYPVVQAPGPCQGINPCGRGECVPTLSGGYSCRCPDLFTTRMNMDGSPMCAPVYVCSYKAQDPCGNGHCVNDGRGLYRCLCSEPGLLKLTDDGDPYCPDPIYRFSRLAQRGDTCEGVASWYNVNLRRFKEMNLNLDCSSPRGLAAGTALTIPVNDLCVRGLTVQKGDTLVKWCAILFGEVMDLPKCRAALASARITADLGAYPVGSSICGATKDPGNGPGVCGGRYYTVAKGDTCVALYVKLYQRKPSRFTVANGSPCTNKGLYPGRALCVS